MNESTMQAVLLRWVMEQKNHEIAIPNLTMMYRWEADVISVTKAHLVHEFEIKVSRSDFLADKKKFKHEFLSQHITWSPNYFWYATWDIEIAEGELPAYAGWLTISSSSRARFGFEVRTKKPAPLLHSEKMRDKDRSRVSRWLSYKLKNMYQQVYLTNK